ncbi:precorrin-2 C(20)-methyltransferase [Propioniciclava sp.]|uniref:precorrin-2 C(20)-methyltransferase n=1 Tax=Propioniciclava sp. TaxID=2038686 RepID=UPI00262726E9|nr:precorrin-2 C(20)-methyltransferase [Propioniciclava sp.]
MDTAARTSTLIGVGVGPGDPQLVTLKAVATLRAADVILVPSTEASGDEAGRAEQIVLHACPESAGKLRRVPFSMAQRTGVGTERRQSWEASAQAAVDAFRAGAATVAFATVGDPSVYSTFSYLAAQVRAAVPDVDVSVVPGITAMQALAAASLTPLVEGRESLTLVPVTAGLGAVGAALDHADTVVAYKGGRQLPGLLALVHDRGLDGVLGVNVGLPDQTITPLSEVESASAPYFSTVLVAPRRTSTGGSL